MAAAEALLAEEQAAGARGGEPVELSVEVEVEVESAAASDVNADSDGEEGEVIELLTDTSSSSAAAAPSASAAAAAMALRAAGGSGLFTELHRSPVGVERVTMDEFLLRMPRAAAEGKGAAASPASPAADLDEAGSGKAAVKFEILVPSSQLLQGVRAKAAVAVVAERVARAQARRVASLGKAAGGGAAAAARARAAVDVAALRSGLQAVLAGLAAGKPTEVLVPAPLPSSAAAATTLPAMAAPPADSTEPGAGSSSTVRYSRVPQDLSPR